MKKIQKLFIFHKTKSINNKIYYIWLSINYKYFVKFSIFDKKKLFFYWIIKFLLTKFMHLPKDWID